MRARTWLATAVACAAPVAVIDVELAYGDGVGGDIPLDGFRPALDARGFVTVDGGEVLAAGEPSFGLVTSWSRGLLELDGADGDTSYRVSDMVSPTLVAAIGLPGPLGLELAMSLPFGVVSADRGPDSDGGTPTEPNDDDDGNRGGQGIGDVGVHVKVRLRERERWAVAAALSLSLPTAAARSWLGSGAASGGGRAIVEWRRDRWRLGANLGLRVRSGGDATFTDDVMTMGVPSTGVTVSMGPTIPASVAASYALAPGSIEVIGELGAQIALRGDYSPIESVAALRVRLAESSHFTLGVGTGLGGGAGNPELRAFAAILFEPRTGRNARVEIEDAPPPSPDAPRPGDRDDDGIVDTIDNCPDDREDFDDYQDDDGCPDTDNDQDGLLDYDDLCPDDPEDFDNLEDEDGCPDTDVDHDRVPDGDDKCPVDPEIYNTHEDEDGCPDRGRVDVTEGSLDVFEEIHFDFNSAVIQERSHDILGVIARTLALNSDITLVEIGGHTDARGSDTYNLWLSQERATSVREFLIDAGVAESRLSAQGYGESAPKIRARTEKAYKANRRVEFLILQRTK